MRPSHFLLAVEQPGDNLAVLLKKMFIIFPVQYYRFYRYWHAADGSLSAAIKDDFCKVILQCRAQDAAAAAEEE